MHIPPVAGSNASARWATASRKQSSAQGSRLRTHCVSTMEIQPFTRDSWNIGSPIVAEQLPWFKGKDVATSLEYANPSKALRDHVDVP
eukprot:3077311-Karenia_brevis.AAC.1